MLDSTSVGERRRFIFLALGHVPSYQECGGAKLEMEGKWYNLNCQYLEIIITPSILTHPLKSPKAGWRARSLLLDPNRIAFWHLSRIHFALLYFVLLYLYIEHVFLWFAGSEGSGPCLWERIVLQAPFVMPHCQICVECVSQGLVA